MNRSIPLILAVALFMEQMDSTVIATSLPAIAADIGTSPITLKLALTSYLVSLGIFIPISGWMADRFGAKRIFRTAIGVFVVGSIACAFSSSVFDFIGARFLQGVGGAMMTPVARLVLVRSTTKAELVNAMATLTLPALIGPVMGPPLGGFITTYFSWHWIFLINVLIGIVGIYFAGRILPEMPGTKGMRLDVLGFTLSGLGAAGLVFGLSIISLPALPVWLGISVTALGLASIGLYYLHATRARAPIIDPKIFRHPIFTKAILGGFIFRIGIGAIPFLLPLYFQLVFKLTPFQSGLLTFASASGALVMKLLAPKLLKLAGFRNILLFSSIVGSVMTAVNGSFTPSTPHLIIISVLLGAGFFRSLYFTAVNALVFADIKENEVSQATTISAALQQISIAIGVAVAGSSLEIIPAMTGRGLDQTAFMFAFGVAGLFCLMAIAPFIRMRADAGAAMSGHQAPTKPVSQEKQGESITP